MWQTARRSIGVYRQELASKNVTIRYYMTVLLLALSLNLVGIAHANTSTSPAFVKNTVDALLAEIGMNPVAAGSERAMMLSETMIGPHLDITAASKRVLGLAWRDATPAQQERFVNAFRTLVVRLFASAIPSFAGAKVEVSPTVKASDRGLETVQTRAVSARGAQSRIDFKLRQDGDKWAVVDFSIDGISMVATYKAEFASIISKDGVAGTIDQVEKRSAEISAKRSQ